MPNLTNLDEEQRTRLIASYVKKRDLLVNYINEAGSRRQELKRSQNPTIQD
jgi:hypothetical protein